MRKICLALFMLFVLVPMVFAATEYVTVGQYFAAFTKEDIELVSTLVSQNDTDAIVNLALQGRVFILEGGKTVFLMDSSWGLVQLRMKGNPQSFWTFREAIKSK